MEKLGSGSYGTVYKINTKHEKSHALKASKAKNFSIGLNDVKEVDISLRLRHPYVIQILDYTSNYIIDDKTSKFTLIYPLANGTLYNLSDKGLSNEEFIKYFLQLLLGLKYVHDRGIILVDINPSNILYFKDEDAVKFNDFGLSVYDDRVFRRWIYGTLIYAAPELINDPKEIYKSSDIWSLGMTFLEMLVGWVPQKIALEKINIKHFKNKNERFEYYVTLLDDELIKAIEEIVNKDILLMLSRMLVLEHNERATADELIQMPIFDKYREQTKILEKLYQGCPINLRYINTYNLEEYREMYNLLSHAYKICKKYTGELWSLFNAVDIINDLLTVNYSIDEIYTTISSIVLSLKLYDIEYYQIVNILKFIPSNLHIDYKKLENEETKVFDKLHGKIYRKNIFGFINDLNIEIDIKKLSKYVLNTKFEGEMPEYALKFFNYSGININNKYISVLKF